MSTLSNTLTSALALALACGVAAAQTPTAASARDGDGSRRPRPPIDTALDANSDEIIDAGEIANALAALKKLDANADGQLTPDEYRPPRPGGRGAGRGGSSGGEAGRQQQGPDGPPPEGGRSPQSDRGTAGGPPTGRRPLPPIVTALDVNSDGEIGANEIADAVKALRKLDSNGDGKLSPDEYRPPRPDGAGAPRGTGGPGGGQ